jgi:hypothetical protein
MCTKTRKIGLALSIGLATKLRPITHINQVPNIVEDLRQHHNNRIRNGSGFIMRAILQTLLNVAKQPPLTGSSYLPLRRFSSAQTALQCVRWRSRSVCSVSLTSRSGGCGCPSIRLTAAGGIVVSNAIPRRSVPFWHTTRTMQDTIPPLSCNTW